MSENYEKFEFPEMIKEANEDVILGPAGETFEFYQTGKTTNGKYLLAKLIVPPHIGPPPHVHHWIDEWFYAPNGGFKIFMGTNEYPNMGCVPGENAPKDILKAANMRPKELFYVERNYIHAFANITNEPQELYLIWTPDTQDISFLPYFLNAGTKKDINNPNQKPDFMSNIRLVNMANKYGKNQSYNFWQYVKKVEEVDYIPDLNNENEKLKILLSNMNERE